MSWKTALISSVITIMVIFLFKQIVKKVDIPIASQIMGEV